MSTNNRSEVPPWAAGTTGRMQELDPELNDAEIATLRQYGSVETFAPGATLWRAGEVSPMMVVLEGHIEVYRRRGGEEDVIITHGPRHYVGETITMSSGGALVSGRAKDALTALVVSGKDLRTAIATEADLGEKLLHSFILRRMRMVAENLANVTLIGHVEKPPASDLQSFLSRNGIPYEILHPTDDHDAVETRLAEHELDAGALPVVICNETALSQPTARDIAECLGFTASIDCGQRYDLAVVGSGPAGLAAAVYAASEGLSVVVLESCAFGGQAASSSKIENYMGFPTGISGQALMGRAYLQAQKFGAHIAIARELRAFEPGAAHHTLILDGGDRLHARTVLIATGAIYRQPAIAGLDGMGGVHYGASYVEGQLCSGQDVAIIGGGNSAGQAAVYLSKKARQVHILVRGKALAASMSDYLVQRIDHLDNVHLHLETEVESVRGDSTLDGITVHRKNLQKLEPLDVTHLFIFIGAQPGTAVFKDQVALDDKGFVLTGNVMDEATWRDHGWSLDRRPHLLETTCPRVFAAGDVRSGSVKRVASAVGEGSVCVQFIHEVLAEMDG